MSNIPSLLLLAFRASPGGSPEQTQRAIEAALWHWKESGNPVYPWAAYRECRAAGLDLPDWVLEYLDHAAEGMWELWQSPPQEKNGIAPAVASALGVKMDGGGSAFARANKTDWVFLGSMVARAIQRGDKEYLAVPDVARRMNRNPSAVQRAWDRYKKTIMKSGTSRQS